MKHSFNSSIFKLKAKPKKKSTLLGYLKPYQVHIFSFPGGIHTEFRALKLKK